MSINTEKLETQPDTEGFAEMLGEALTIRPAKIEGQLYVYNGWANITMSNDDIVRIDYYTSGMPGDRMKTNISVNGKYEHTEAEGEDFFKTLTRIYIGNAGK